MNTNWRSVWNQICDMAYYKKNIVSQILVEVDELSMDDPTLDSVWAEYSKTKIDDAYIGIHVIPELQKIFVPRELFEAPGVYTWFSHCFPNCVVTFWDD
jgi:hypothetical protein